jgi:hypothetical protein
MKIIAPNGRLNIPLYHGTSSLFLDSIARNGLGGINPVKEQKMLEFGGLVWTLVEEYLDPDVLKLKRAPFRSMLEQEITRGLNYQHGQTYLTPSKENAAGYATSMRYGSELLSYILEFLEELTKLNLKVINKDLFQRYEGYFKLLQLRPASLLIEVRGLHHKDLLDEFGNDPTGHLEYLQARVPDSSYLNPRHQKNFRLLRTVPATKMKIWMLDVYENDRPRTPMKFRLFEVVHR